MQSLIVSYLSKFFKELVVNYKAEDFTFVDGCLELNDIEFECSFFNSFLSSEYPLLRVKKVTASYLRLKIPSVFNIKSQTLVLYLGIVNVDLSSEENGNFVKSIKNLNRTNSDTESKDDQKYGFSKKMVDSMQLKCESVNISIKMASQTKKAANYFLFKLYFFNSILFNTDEKFKERPINEINTDFGGYFLIHKMFQCRFSCAELYYNPVNAGKDELKHFVLFSNQPVDAFLMMKKNSAGIKMSVMNVFELNDITLKINMEEFEIFNEFVLSIVKALKKEKRQRSLTKSPGMPRVVSDGPDLFSTPSFLTLPPLITKLHNVNSSSLLIKSIVLYITKSGNGNNTDLQVDRKSFFKKINSTMKNTENFDYHFKLLIQNISFGTLVSKDISILSPEKASEEFIFNECVVSATVQNFSLFYSIENSDESVCLFSTFKKTDANQFKLGARRTSELSQKPLSPDESFPISDRKPLYFWDLDTKNFFSLKTTFQLPMDDDAKNYIITDVRFRKIALLFDLSKWSKVYLYVKKLLKTRFNLDIDAKLWGGEKTPEISEQPKDVKTENLSSIDEKSEKSEKKGKSENDKNEKLVKTLKDQFKNNKKAAMELKKFLGEMVLRFEIECVSSVIMSDEKTLFEEKLKGFRISNSRHMAYSMFQRKLYSIKPMFLDSDSFKALEIHFKSIKLSVLGKNFILFDNLNFGKQTDNRELNNFVINLDRMISEMRTVNYTKYKANIDKWIEVCTDNQERIKMFLVFVLKATPFSPMLEAAYNKLHTETFDFGKIKNTFLELKNDKEFLQKIKDILINFVAKIPKIKLPSRKNEKSIPFRMFINNDETKITVGSNLENPTVLSSMNCFAFIEKKSKFVSARVSSTDLRFKALRKGPTVLKFMMELSAKDYKGVSVYLLNKSDAFDNSLAMARKTSDERFYLFLISLYLNIMIST